MKRYFCIVLIIVIVLSGCNENTNADVVSVIKGEKSVQHQDEDFCVKSAVVNTTNQCEVELALSAYLYVLENKNEVYIPSQEQKKYIKDLTSDEVSITQYAIVDLDSDKVPEVVLWLSYGTNEYYGFYVLHSYQETVNLFGFTYRGMNQLKEDGTFCWSGSAFYHGISKINFNDCSYTKNDLAYCEQYVDGNINYYVGNENVSKEDYFTFQEEQDQKPCAIWYEYSIDEFKKSIDCIISNDLGKNAKTLHE